MAMGKFIRHSNTRDKDIEALHALEEGCGYHFKNFGLLVNAMRHTSYCNEHHIDKALSNERLEFLGDAVLEAVSSEFLYLNFPGTPEGELSKLRASLVCETTLAFDAEALQLGRYLLLGNGEEATGGRNRASIVSDACEALIGAIFLDGGFAAAKEFILKFIMNDVEHKQLFHDSKTALQEIVQRDFEAAPVYTLQRESGPDHNKSFTVNVSVNGKVYGTGEGRTKKAAEQAAAYEAIRKLQES